MKNPVYLTHCELYVVTGWGVHNGRNCVWLASRASGVSLCSYWLDGSEEIRLA